MRSALPTAFGKPDNNLSEVGGGTATRSWTPNVQSASFRVGSPDPRSHTGGGGGPGGDISQPDPIKYRSVHEKRIGDEILRQEGTWDAENQVFLTKQRQLQERTRLFTKMSLTLRHSPQLAYRMQSQDMTFVYPNAPAELLKHHYTPHSQLSEVDPTPENIGKKSREQVQVAQERKLKGVSNQVSGSAAGAAFSSQKEAEEVIQQLERDLRMTAESVARPESTRGSTTAGVKPFRPPRSGDANSPAVGRQRAVPNAQSTRSLLSPEKGKSSERRSSLPAATDGSSSSSTVGSKEDGSTPSKTTASTGRRSLLPTLKEDGSGYSSLLMQLRKTKKGVEDHHSELSTIRSILSMEGSADLKRTITKMFADPKNADHISAEEHERREKLFEDERKRTLVHQTSLLKEERAVMERELAQLQM